MASIFLRRTLTGFVPVDQDGAEDTRAFKVGQVYRADLVRPRSYQAHKLCFALLSLTYKNLPENMEGRFRSFDHFRKCIALEAGHVEQLVRLDGEIIEIPGSMSFDAMDQSVFDRVFPAMMTVCCRILGVSAPELEGEVSRYADAQYGSEA